MDTNLYEPPQQEHLPPAPPAQLGLRKVLWELVKIVAGGLVGVLLSLLLMRLLGRDPFKLWS